ncbi:MAG TPA: hypothetical protein VHE54_03770 [Puia sp.]|nr:hypothetical protein [Puia sp.]
MTKQMSSLLIKICILVGAFFLGLAARSHAQTVGGSAADNARNPADTVPHYRMHRGWSQRSWTDGSGNDTSTPRFRRPYAYGRPGGHGFHGGGYANRPWGHGPQGTQYTPEQRRQIAAINRAYRQKAADLFKQDNITLKQYKAGLLALQKERKQKTEALLTPEQKERLAARRKRMSENVQVREAAHLERLKLRLDLSDDQVAKLKTGQEDLRSQARSIRENDNLLPQEKRQELKALMAKRNDNFKSVLTPDQYSQFEKMFHHRPGGFGRPGRHFGNPNGPGGPASSATI